MPSVRVLGLLVAAGVMAGCGSLFAPPPLPADWNRLTGGPEPFAALYRLDCCGRRDLLCTVRYDGPHLELTVAGQPGAAVLRAWLAPEGGWLLARSAGCVQHVAGDVLPLGEGSSLPLDPALTAVLLRGRLPAGGHPVADRSGWVAGVREGRPWRARVEGGPLRCTRLEIGAGAAGNDGLTAVLGAHRLVGVPGTLDVRVGSHRVRLDLVEMRGAALLARPAWVAEPRCAETP